MQPESFPITVKRSKRKTLVIYVRSGGVEVRAPLQAPQSWIDEFISRKQPWIVEKLQSQRQKDSERLRLRDGGLVLYKGKPHRLILQRGRNAIRIDEGIIYFQARRLEEDYLAQQWQRWLLQQAKMIFEPKVWQQASLMGLGHKLRQVRFRRTKTKWGHCTAQGVLQFNPLLLMAPESVQEYLVIHELSHLRHMNHSKSFWRLVATYWPNYKEPEQWLTDHGHKLWL